MKKKSVFMIAAEMWSLLSQLAIMVLVSILGCFFIGKFIDSKLGTYPMFIVIFLLLGIGGAFMSVYKVVIRYAKRK